MQWWKKTFQAIWMSDDVKPKSEYKRRVSRKTRAQLKVDLKKKFRDAVTEPKE